MSTIKPVTIPREVADAIEKMRSDGHDNESVIYAVINPTRSYDDRLTHLRSIEFNTLLSALVNGYERELTEEECRHATISGRYVRHIEGAGDYDYSYADTAHAEGIEWVLNELGIVISGINDAEEGGAA